ncbi:hypothetical protein RCL_jg9378.t1 [Rhizophagus clarus]|uniref:Uncharacterized protein n=1 Tax=Rhizophagus clarus TaxID=94130 RepID=A0A8H3M7Q2_9GLOM|nr:hypothetical protein RCL_jg9378.t1 [Rhizophagus clarus]
MRSCEEAVNIDETNYGVMPYVAHDAQAADIYIASTDWNYKRQNNSKKAEKYRVNNDRIDSIKSKND